MRRGEVWRADLPEPWGRRPVVLLARNEAYEILTWVTVAPLTTTIRDIPTAVLLDPHVDGVPRRCVVALDNLQSIRKEWLSTVVTSLPPETMRAIDRAIRFALDLRD
ncbi:MAG: type II toxin-antitoxin system PemK/MazF family toxin [Chloroflexota bacterium]